MVDPPCDIDLARTACECAEHILAHYLRVPVVKARMTLAIPGDFDLAVARLASDLQAHSEKPEKAALEAALQTLDIDWASTSPQQRRELVSGAVGAARRQLGTIHQAVGPALTRGARRVVEAAKSDARECQGLDIGNGFTALDERMMQFMARSESLLIRDQFGKRLDVFAASARQVVADSMAAGLGRDDIVAELARSAHGGLRVARNESYWQVVAGAFVGRGRSYAQMGAYREAGLTRYRVVAVMDERTSAVCRMMHGRILTVAAGVNAFERAENSTDTATLQRIYPWPSLSELKAGAAERLTSPPFHGLCRSTTVGLTGSAH